MRAAPVDLVKFLRIPAAFIAANWAGLLCVLSVVGLVPGLAGNARVTADLDEHADIWLFTIEGVVGV